MITDLHHYKLAVARTESEGDCVVTVMEKTPNLHHCLRSLFDKNGIEYPVHLYNPCPYFAKDDDLWEYSIEFVDQSIRLPKGTELELRPPEWVLRVPNCALLKLEYRSEYGFPDFNVSGESQPVFKTFDDSIVSVNSTGHISLSHGISENLADPQKATLQISTTRARALLYAMLRCVSEVDCYEEFFSDDSARSIAFIFENGEEIAYNGVFCHGKTSTIELISAFLQEIDAASLVGDGISA